MKFCVLHNNKSGGFRTLKQKITAAMPDEKLYFRSMPAIKDFKKFFKDIDGDDVIICGGDGTINYFINKINGIKRKSHIWYFNAGSGNDFHKDVDGGGKPYCIEQYIKDLPQVTVHGKKYLTINGAGCGIDSYACDEGEKKRKRDGKPVNYARQAIKGIMGGFKPFNAKVVVDGKEYDFKNVWLLPVMKGSYFGGGIKAAPNQKRMKDDKLTMVAISKASRLRFLMVLGKGFSGKHIKYKKFVKLIRGYDFKVELDRKMPIQIDGELVSDVIKYQIKAPKK